MKRILWKPVAKKLVVQKVVVVTVAKMENAVQVAAVTDVVVNQ